MRLTSFTLVGLAACSACSTPDAPRHDGGDAGTLDNDTSDVDLGGDDDEVTYVRDPACDAATPWIAKVTGAVQDEAGAGLAEARAQACIVIAPTGQLLCIQPAVTAADGAFAVTVPSTARCMTNLVL